MSGTSIPIPAGYRLVADYLEPTPPMEGNSLREYFAVVIPKPGVQLAKLGKLQEHELPFFGRVIHIIAVESVAQANTYIATLKERFSLRQHLAA